MSWVPDYRCCWCGSSFVQRKVHGADAWTCPTDACFERQLEWIMLDKAGRLFYLPLPRQVEVEEAIASQQFGAIGVGGHRNSGKSAMLRRVSYRLCQYFADFAVLFLRRNLTELHLNHQRHAIKECKRIGAKYSVRQIDFPDTGSELIWGHCFKPDDWKQFIGAEVDLIIFEQLEEFEQTQFVEISAATGRTRSRSDWRGLVLAGENPGGPLSAFISDFFITKNPDPQIFPDYNPHNYHFIHASLEDNPYADPRYVDNLATLSPARRQMFRYGRRDIFPLQFFKTFLRPDRVQRLSIPPKTPRLCALHWAFFKPGIFLWAVVLDDGRLYIEREYTFLETIASDVARAIITITREHQWSIGGYAWGNAPGKIKEDEIGENTFETLYNNGLPVVQSMHDPVAGWQRLQHWFEPMRTDDGEQAALIISPDCESLIRTLPQLLQDRNDLEDVDDDGATYAAKALRYLVMARPEPPTLAPPLVGRDLSKLPPRVRAEIEWIRACDAAEEGAATADTFSMGEFWGADHESR